MKRLWVGILLALMCLVSGDARQALAVTASWAEEMNALPGAQWGLFDDFQNPAFKDGITLVDVSGGAGTGAWKHSESDYNGPTTPRLDDMGNQERDDEGNLLFDGEGFGTSSMGMVLVSGDGIPIDALASMAGPAPAKYTAEIAFKIVTPLPAGDAGNENDSLWFNVGGGAGSSNSGADIRMFEGKNYFGQDSRFQSVSGESTQGSEPGTITVPTGDFAGTTRGQWHTLRLIHDEGVPSGTFVPETDPPIEIYTNASQKVYIDGVLIATHDTSQYNRAWTFTRGLAFGFFLHQDGSVPYPEVHYDYIRLANGIVPIGEAINPIPEPASGLLTLVVAGLGLAARRRQA